MSNSNSYERLKNIDYKSVWHPFTQHSVWFDFDEPLIVERGEGVELIDVNSKRYLDGVSSLWCNVHGHGRPELIQALHEQVDSLCHSTLLGLSHVPILELTEKLMAVTPEHLTRAFYSDSGSAAVEAAIRMAVEWWQKEPSGRGRKKTKVVSLSSGYHGDTLGSVGLGYLREFHGHLDPVIVPSLKITPPHVFRFYQGMSEEESLEASLAEIRALFESQASEIAAFIIEPLVQGAAGIWVQPVEFGAEVSRLCKEYDILLVADEVATGFGKTGTMFAVEQGPIKPDILTMGKGLSGGLLPISAALATEEIFEGFLGATSEMKTFFFGQTFCGNPLAARASCASLDLFKSTKLLGSLKDRIEHFGRELEKNIAPLNHVCEIRRCGVMTGIELTKSPGKWEAYGPDELAGVRITKEARQRGAIVRPLGNAMVLMPALVMGEEDLSNLVRITAESICAALGE